MNAHELISRTSLYNVPQFGAKPDAVRAAVAHRAAVSEAVVAAPHDAETAAPHAALAEAMILLPAVAASAAVRLTAAGAFSPSRDRFAAPVPPGPPR